MTEEKVLTQADIGISIDPSSWKEPVQEFPGLVVESQYRLAPDSYKKATEFRPAIEDDLPQWSLRIKRLDAIFVTPEGGEADAIRYGGIDLRKWSPSQGMLVDINPNFAKEHYIVTEWKRIVKDIEPPTILEGSMFMFNFWANKRFGNMTSRNVTVPTSILPPEYVYAGEVQRIQLTARDDEAETTTGKTMDLEAATNAVVEALPGLKVGDAQGILAAIPEDARAVNAVVSGIVTGDLIDDLIDSGRIGKNDEGVFVSA